MPKSRCREGASLPSPSGSASTSMTTLRHSRYTAKRPRVNEGDAHTIEISNIIGGINQKSLVDMWREGRFCDAAVLIDGQRFDVHRVILAVSSPFFARAFEGGFSETRDCEIKIELPGGAEAWNPIAEFIYTGKCLLDVGSLLPLLEAAHYVQCTDLVEQVTKAIATRITPATFADAWAAAGRLTMPKFEEMLVFHATGSVENITTFACSPIFASLPEKVLSRITNSTTSQRTKIIRLIMERDGPPSREKLLKARKTFELLGGRLENVSFTIDKQAKVEVSWLADPETCDGDKMFSFDFASLIHTFAPGKAQLNTCLYEPKTGEGPRRGEFGWGANPNQARYDFFDEQYEVDRVFVAEGFPKTVRASPNGPPLSHYLVHLDVGLSYANACEKLARKQSVGRQVVGEGFYCSDAPQPGCTTKRFALLVRTGQTSFTGYTPEGRTFHVAHLEKFLDENSIVHDNGEGWTRAYDAALTRCVHGAHCGRGVASKDAELAREEAVDTVKRFAAATGVYNAPVAPVDEPGDGSMCMKGRRLRSIHLVTGDGILPLWGKLKPHNILRVRTSADSPATLIGVWVDPANIPKY